MVNLMGKSLERQESQEASEEGLSREQQHFYQALGKNKKKVKGLMGGGSGGELSSAAMSSARSKHTASRRKQLGPSTPAAPLTASHQRLAATKTSSKGVIPTILGKGEPHQQSVDSKEDSKEGKKEASGHDSASGWLQASQTPVSNRGSKMSLNTGAKGKLGDPKVK